jgi:la-related protein 1
LEEKLEDFQRAISIAQMGLDVNPRYGPLWFTLLRLYERISQMNDGDLSSTRAIVEDAVMVVPRELKWKIYFEAAQIEERVGRLDLTREAYVKSVTHCPRHLLWKVWLAGARTELKFHPNGEGLKSARKLIQRSLKEVPEKKKSQVFLEWARVEEYSGFLDKARSVLLRAKKEARHEWKVFLEAVLLELRAGDTAAAMKEALDALKTHVGTGRLWSLLIQMHQTSGEKVQLELFKQALQEVPKSGEVWCEGARVYLAKKDWQKARRFLDFAIHFTPQYGDSFIEYLRLELLEKGPDADFSKLELVSNLVEDLEIILEILLIR